MYELDEKVLLNFLRKQYPKSCIQFAGMGWSSTVFYVDEYVIRFPRQNMSDYKFEVDICNRLRKMVSFEIPFVEIISDLTFPYARHKCIKGSTWNGAFIRNSTDELGKDCALFLSQLHSYGVLHDVRKAPESSNLSINSLEIVLSHFFPREKVTKLCELYDIETRKTLEKPVLIHADFHGNNSVVNSRGRLVGVFDWCNSGLGERERDFIFLYNKLYSMGINAIIHEYERLSGIKLNEERIRSLTLIKLINKLYWANNSNNMKYMLSKQIERYLK